MIRRAARFLHKTLGWTTGAIACLLCATGAILLAQPEIEEIANPERARLSIDSSRADVLPLDAFVAQLEETESATFERPTTVRATRLFVETKGTRPWRAIMTARDANSKWSYVAYVDPRTGLGVSYGASRAHEFFKTVRRLHTRLGLPPRVGRPIVGYATLAFLFALATGVVRRLPARLRASRLWKNALTIAARRGLFRAVLDIHGAFGLYSALILGAVALTGCWLSFGWFRSFVDELVGYDETHSTSVARFEVSEVDSSRASLQEIFDAQRALTPEVVSYDVKLSETGSKNAICISETGGFCRPTEYYWDPYTGEHLGVSRFRDQPLGRRLRVVAGPLHQGTLYGSATRLLFFIACLLGVVISASGYWLTWMRWDQEEKASKKKAQENDIDDGGRFDNNAA